MSDWQSQGYDPARRQQPATPPQWAQPEHRRPMPALPDETAAAMRAHREGYQQQPRASVPRKTGLTAAEMFWYVIGNIAFGAMYFAKIPSKKALSDFGMAEMTAAESFWY